MKQTVSWLVIVVLAAGTVSGWYLYQQEQQTSEQIQRELDAFRGIQDETAQLTPARFIRVEGATLFFGLPTQVERNGQVFVEYQERQGIMADPETIIRAVEPPFLTAIEPGHELRLDLEGDPQDPQQYVINAVYILD